MKFKIQRLESGEEAFCESIMRSLPKWFGIESAIVQYAKDVKTMETYTAIVNNSAVGFITINRHNKYSAEIHVMAIRSEYHRMGIGRALLSYVEKILVNERFEYLQVKTLGPSHPDPNYAQTRIFYETVGFRPLEENDQIWSGSNPCLIMIKSLKVI